LVQWVFETSPHDLVQLKAESLNALACRFYQRLGFTAVGKSLTKSGLEMTCYEATRQDIARSLHSVGAAASPSRA
jgi:ribosomal protein S18 acetylase RimI-like enzyme